MVRQSRYLQNYVLADRDSHLHQVQVHEVVDYDGEQIVRVSYQGAEVTGEPPHSVIDGDVLSGTLSDPGRATWIGPAERHDVALLLETSDEMVLLAVFADPESGRLFAIDVETLRDLSTIRSPYDPTHGFTNKDLRIR